MKVLTKIEEKLVFGGVTENEEGKGCTEHGEIKIGNNEGFTLSLPG